MVRLQRKNSLRMPELHCSGHPKQQLHTEQDPQKDQTSHPPNPDAYFTRLPAPAKTVSSPKDTPFPGRATASDHLLLYKGVAGMTQLRVILTRPSTGTPRRAIYPGEGLPNFLCLSWRERSRLPYSPHIERARFSCALCEQEGHLAAPPPSFLRRALREHGVRPSYPAVIFSSLLRCLEPASRSERTPHRPGLG